MRRRQGPPATRSAPRAHRAPDQEIDLSDNQRRRGEIVLLGLEPRSDLRVMRVREFM
jgi:hypothetical protein